MDELIALLQANPSAVFSDPLMLALLLFSGLLLLAIIVGGIVTLLLGIKYFKYNRQPVSSGVTAIQAAERLLAAKGLSDVKVVKEGFFRELFYGNYYSGRTKTVYLRGGIAHKNSVTSVGVAIQKAGLAMLDAEHDKQFQVRDKLQGLFLFSPVFFIGVLLVGGLFDYLINKSLGNYTMIAAIAGLAFYFAATIFTLFTITTEKKAGKIALKALSDFNLMTPDEIVVFQKLQSYYMIKYVLDFIITLLRLILYILKLFAKSRSKSS